MLRIARHHGFALLAPIPHDRTYADAKSREQWDIPIGSQSLLLAKIPGPWPAARDLGALKRELRGLEGLLGVRIVGRAPWCAVPAPSYMQGWGDSVGEHARILAFTAKI